jgi:hypothetical protein
MASGGPGVWKTREHADLSGIRGLIAARYGIYVARARMSGVIAAAIVMDHVPRALYQANHAIDERSPLFIRVGQSARAARHAIAALLLFLRSRPTGAYLPRIGFAICPVTSGASKVDRQGSPFTR